MALETDTETEMERDMRQGVRTETREFKVFDLLAMPVTTTASTYGPISVTIVDGQRCVLSGGTET